ncbi:hypothetical protein sscle_10g075990 [Sclerotinia sclerotiorum 1980 UF-70]|uniref:Uncharacterized protein n=2 Tax=Sclerotinia sclerotiorum (strain ATCC 18683 / 1980 / Ss-1) TaxID=665079 RepID=A0A1D9QD79_SCLS1|nr:hypothetical protein sscle_10g075990 [Sclerotinia sclerotiorum 1980 UF-70]
MEPNSSLKFKKNPLGLLRKSILLPKFEPNPKLQSADQSNHKLTMLVANYGKEKKNRDVWKTLEEQLEKIEKMAAELKTACRVMLDEEID